MTQPPRVTLKDLLPSALEGVGFLVASGLAGFTIYGTWSGLFFGG